MENNYIENFQSFDRETVRLLNDNSNGKNNVILRERMRTRATMVYNHNLAYYYEQNPFGNELFYIDAWIDQNKNWLESSKVFIYYGASEVRSNDDYTQFTIKVNGEKKIVGRVEDFYVTHSRDDDNKSIMLRKNYFQQLAYVQHLEERRLELKKTQQTETTQQIQNVIMEKFEATEFNYKSFFDNIDNITYTQERKIIQKETNNFDVFLLCAFYTEFFDLVCSYRIDRIKFSELDVTFSEDIENDIFSEDNSLLSYIHYQLKKGKLIRKRTNIKFDLIEPIDLKYFMSLYNALHHLEDFILNYATKEQLNDLTNSTKTEYETSEANEYVLLIVNSYFDAQESLGNNPELLDLVKDLFQQTILRFGKKQEIENFMTSYEFKSRIYFALIAMKRNGYNDDWKTSNRTKFVRIENIVKDIKRPISRIEFKNIADWIDEIISIEEPQQTERLDLSNTSTVEKIQKPKPKPKPKPKTLQEFFKDGTAPEIIKSLQDKYKDYNGKKMAYLIYLLHKEFKLINYSLRGTKDNRKRFVNEFTGKNINNIEGINKIFNPNDITLGIDKYHKDNDYITIQNEIQTILNPIK